MDQYVSPRRIAFAVVLAVAACSGRDDLDGRRRQIPGIGERGRTVDITGGETVHYDLYDNRASALVWSAGTLIIETTPTVLAKFVDGEIGASWHPAPDGKAAFPAGITAELAVPIDFDADGIAPDRDGAVGFHVAATPAAAGQLMSLLVNERRVGDVAMPEPVRGKFRVAIPAGALSPGEASLRLFFRRSGDVAGFKTAGAIERIGIGRGPLPDQPVMIAGPVTRAGERLQALSARTAARISFYVIVPAGKPELVFAAGAAPASKLAVRIAADGRAAHAAWERAGTPGWERVRVDLEAYAGQAVRIDLASTGPADWGRPRLVTREAPPARPTLAPADHVIVWVVSSLRADRLDARSARTPAMSRFASRALWFDAITTAATSGPAHMALMTGRRAREGRIPAEIETLGERFHDAGFATALISGNGFVADDQGFARGFDQYDNPMRRRHPHGARTLWQTARRFLAQHVDGHAFLFIATSEPHVPYTPTPASLALEWTAGPRPPAPARPGAGPSVGTLDPARTADLAAAVQSGKQALTADQQAFIRALYDAELRDADAGFAEMLADLDELGIADRTAIILVGDVGEELFERGAFGHGHQIHRETARVPLAIAAPGLAARRVSELWPSLVDVAPTVMTAGGIAPGAELHGDSLIGPASSAWTVSARPAITHLPGQARAIAMGDIRLLVSISQPLSLFDLAADPDERSNRASSRPIAARALRNVLALATAYEDAWNRRRWGSEASVSEAFAPDHGL